MDRDPNSMVPLKRGSEQPCKSLWSRLTSNQKGQGSILVLSYLSEANRTAVSGPDRLRADKASKNLEERS